MEQRNRSLLRFAIYMLASITFFIAGCVSSPQNDLTRGTFVDAGKVKGLEYRSGLRRGITDGGGTFYFVEGDTMEFYIGGVRIGNAANAVAGASALDLVAKEKRYVTNDAVLNISRFLQSLDSDNTNDNGIEITDSVSNQVAGTVLDFDRSAEAFETDPVIIDLFARLGRTLKSVDEAKDPLVKSLIENGVKIPAVLINLGDGWPGGAQSGLVNMTEHTQINAYPEALSAQLGTVFDLVWDNALLTKNDDGTLTRKYELTPYNLGVAGATVKSLLYEKTGSGNSLLDEILTPLPEYVGTDLGQIEAAEFLANELHPERLKFITLDIGREDVLGAATTELGTRLDAASVSAYLADTESGHDMGSIMENLGAIIQRLAAIPDAYVFVANIPYVHTIGAVFDEYDIEALAVPADADVTVLPEGAHLGISAFMSLGDALGPNSDNTTLNSRIAELTAVQGNLLTNETVWIINPRVNEINALISSLADAYPNVYVVDLYALFNDAAKGDVTVTTDAATYTMSMMHGGGFFSMDGYNPSTTGYAIISNTFVETINASDLKTHIAETNTGTVWTLDTPYRDFDEDEYMLGPGSDVMDAAYAGMADCSDVDGGILSPMLSGGVSCE